MSECKRLCDIEAKPIPRVLTGYDELDFIYGYSKFPEAIYWGMPQGKISLWAGTSGIGKSRLAIDLAKYISQGSKVLYFLTEASQEDFAGWCDNTEHYSNIYCSDADNLVDMIKDIYKVQPSIVIVDSVNEMEDFSCGNKKESSRLIKGDSETVGFKRAINDIGGHLILLAQLNADGSIKGGTSLPHLVDIALNIKPYTKESKSLFTVSVGVKHRCGRRDDSIYGVWMHEESGVRSCSDLRLSDPKWCESKGLALRTRAEVILGRQAGEQSKSDEVIIPSLRKKMLSWGYWF